MAIDHLGNVSPDPHSWALAQLILLSAFAVAVLSFCIAALTAPSGRGWRPALGALGIVFLFVVVFFIHASSGAGFGE
jgi:hypothetical protein